VSTAANWREEREAMRKRIAVVSEKGLCFLCEDLKTGAIIGPQPLLYEDDKVKVSLDRFPRTKGHTVVVLKEHRDDLSELTDEETVSFFGSGVRTMRAIRKALGAERVYLVALNDPPISHVHMQLVPRYPGESAGPRKLVRERSALVNAEQTMAAIRKELGV
jgi:diadenosine tetraphosphate (Ap4A) HIT family hydrolase